MQLLTILNAIESIENSVADLYEWFSDCLSHDPEASGVFFRLAMQEKTHASMVAFSKSLVRKSPSNFAAIDFDMTLVDDLLGSIAAFRYENPQPSLEQALDFAIAIEGHAAEGLHRSMVIQSNPEVANMINNLAKADLEHLRLLRDYSDRIRRQISAAG
jgi:rubrerythrin